MVGRVLICGSREWTNRDTIRKYIRTLRRGTVVIHGAARGADRIAGFLAKSRGLTVEVYPAQWEKHGKAAGPIRNQQMLTEGQPHLVVYFHEDIESSKGTADMVRRARKTGVPVQDGRDV